VGDNTGMGRPRFFHHAALGSGELELDAAEARHAVGARRLREGDVVVLFDGAGREADAELIALSSRRVLVRVGAVRDVPRAAARELTLAVSLPSPARQDTLVEKCTELGVTAIRPIRVERSVADASAGRIERWHRISVAAAKQSEQAWLPELHEPAAIGDVLDLAGKFELVLLADPSSEAWPLPTVLERRRQARTVLAFIGPEGGFTEQVHALLVCRGAQPCRLTPTILRVETAAIALASVVLCQPCG